MIHYVEGDLFDNEFNVQAYAHGCNCMGVMGKGIAVTFKQLYLKMYRFYRWKCKHDELHEGDIFLWLSPTTSLSPHVFNLMTQEKFEASLAAIGLSLTRMRIVADAREITSIAMPKIGAGLGGLDWEDIKTVVEKTFGGWEGELYVYEKYTPK